MNPNTGEVRQFASSEAARAAGFRPLESVESLLRARVIGGSGPLITDRDLDGVKLPLSPVAAAGKPVKRRHFKQRAKSSR